MTAGDVIAMLRRHYLPEGRPPGGVFAAEIEAPNGRRRADLLWVPLTIAGGREIVGHEVKVSRADVLAELADPMKADAWMRYCDEWWLVVSDPTLVEGLEIPELWGVMAPPSGRRTRSMTTLRKAPRLKPVDRAPAYETIAKWLHWRHHHLQRELSSSKRDAQHLRQANHDLQQRVPYEGMHKQRVNEVVETIIRDLGGADRDRIGSWQHQVEIADVVEALKHLGAVYDRARTVEFQVKNALSAVRNVTMGIDPAAVDELSKAVSKIRDRQPDEAAA